LNSKYSIKVSCLQQKHIYFRNDEMRQLPSSEKFLGAGKGVGAGADEPLEHELSMEPERKYYLIGHLIRCGHIIMKFLPAQVLLEGY